jgi:hypothetical protein
MLLAASAKKAEVDAAVARAAHDDEPASTAAAPQRTLEVMVVSALPGSASAVEFKHPLYPIKYLRAHQRLVPAGVLLAVALDDA